MIVQAAPLIADWLRSYLSERDIAPTTAKTYACAVRSFERFHGGPATVPQLAEQINEYLSLRASKGSRHTTRCYRTALVALLRAAAEAGFCQLPRRIKPVRTVAHAPRGFTLDEICRLLEHASPIQRAAILVAYHAAFRRGDVFELRWPPRDVESAGRVSIVCGKTGRLEWRRLPPAVFEACRVCRVDGDHRLVPWPMKMTGWRKAWQRLGKAAGVDVKGRGLQAIRRTAATLTAKEHGVAAAVALLGHSPRTGFAVFEAFYRVGELLDNSPVGPPPLENHAAKLPRIEP